MKLLFRRGQLEFEAEILDVVVDGPLWLVYEAQTDGSIPAVPRTIVVKWAKGEDGKSRIALEREACQRLEHASLATHFGATTSDDLGIGLAFERLRPNPLLLLNEPSRRPRFRDPHTHAYPLPLPRAIELAFDALNAIAHVHSRGYVHGGVTLSNLLLRTPDDSRVPEDVLRHVSRGTAEGVLAGLGAARSVSFLERARRGSVSQALLPHAMSVLSAPETIFERAELGGRLHFSPAMDVYAWGLVFYMLLTGRIPYDHARKPHELQTELIPEIKLRETQGKLSPIDLASLDALPLHDVAFGAPAEEIWPGFRSALAHVLRRCVDADPAKRMTAEDARAIFEQELGMRSSVREARAWVQKTLQMHPESNRLLGDLPRDGLVLREPEQGVFTVETRAAQEEAPVVQAMAVGEGSIVAFRQTGLGKTLVGAIVDRKGLPTAPPGTVWLRELLVDLQEKNALRARGPYLLTSSGLAPRELARCLVLPIGDCAPKLKVIDMKVREQRRITIGRSNDNDFVVPDELVSKRHAALELVGNRWWIEDLRSANGTMADGAAVASGSRAALKSVSTILLGAGTELCFMEDEPFEKFLQTALGVVIQGIAHRAGKPTPIPGRGRPTLATPSGLPAAGSARDIDVVDPFANHQPGGATRIMRSPFAAPRPAAAAAPASAPATSPEPQPAIQAPAPSPRPKVPLHLEDRLRRHFVPGTLARIVRTGVPPETATTVATVVALATAAGDTLETIALELPGGELVIVYWKTDPLGRSA